jgi:hypothetical protein
MSGGPGPGLPSSVEISCGGAVGEIKIPPSTWKKTCKSSITGGIMGTGSPSFTMRQMPPGLELAASLAAVAKGSPPTRGAANA